MAQEQVVVIGHSFVKSCELKCDSDPTLFNLGLDDARTRVIWRTDINGEGVYHVNQINEWRQAYPEEVAKTDLCLVDLSSNDLKGFFFKDGRSLAANMLTAAIYLRDAGAKRVAIFQCMERYRLGCVPQRLHNTATEAEIQQYMYDFNKGVQEYNTQLSSFVDETKGKAGIVVLPWNGITIYHPHNLSPDGIHLSNQFQTVYWRNLRRHAIRQLSKARPSRNQE